MSVALPEPSRPRVCLATASPEPSGVGRHLMDLASGAAERFDVVLLAPSSTDLLQRAERAGVPAFAFPADPEAWFADQSFHVVHVHAGIGWEGHELTRAAARAGSTVIRTEHLPWLLDDPDQVAEYHDALTHVARVVAVSDGVARSFVAAGVPAAKVTVVPNGIDVPEPRPCSLRDDLGATGPLVVHVGRFTPQKRHDLLLRAFGSVLADLPTAHLALVGTGPLRDDSERLAHDLGIAHRVAFLGLRDDVVDILAASDVLALPSDFEGMPLVLLEAMASRTPAVCTDVTGIADVVDHTSAFLVPADDATALADALVHALTDRDDASRRAATARGRYLHRHTCDAMRAATLDVYAAELGVTG